MTKHDQILRNIKYPEMHVHHGFEGKSKSSRTLNKQIVVQSWKMEYN